ncbi:MYG1 family protein, partial [Patescibacteria group bacterium]|nr:MYG1 family protein [Patescibacteria group bacterium]
MRIQKSTTDKKIKIVTHSGDFHADDVFAVAVITLFLGDAPYQIIRTHDMEIIKKGDFVVDVGGVFNSAKNKFDHHQITNKCARDNGIPYASFGLVWKKFGVKLGGSKYIADAVEKQLVLPIDAVDNGVDIFSKKLKDVIPYTIHNILKIFCPIEKQKITEREFNIAFIKIVKIAQKILLYEIQRARNENKNRKYIEKAYCQAKDKRIIIINQDYQHEEIIARFAEPLFVVKPDKGNGW